MYVSHIISASSISEFEIGPSLHFDCFNLLMKRRARADTLNIFVMEEYVSHLIPSGVQAHERYVGSSDACVESKPSHFSGFVFLISDSYSKSSFS